PTPVEISALELVVLAALDAAAGVEPVERTLSPRLARRCQEPESPLCLALELRAGGERGRARLLLPPSAVRALRAPPAFPEALCRFPVPCSLRSGRASPDAGELEALRPGDVLVLDAAGEPDALVLPGGGRI